MNLRKYIAAILFLSILVVSSPLGVRAQSATDTIPPVPVSDSAIRSKEVGITVFGFTIPGLAWDTLAIIAAKQIIEQVVDSTISWINSGFEGNPAYVTNPGRYFGDIADGIAGGFIEGSDLAFLCSPFQAQIKLSLARVYTQPRQFQCTLTDVVENIEDFYGDFSKGGWDAWFSMTQNSTNNPYGAYLEAKLELDSRIANALNIKDKQLQWDSGFLAYSECLEENPGPFHPAHDEGKAEGECLQRGETKTPGKVIESQLENVLGTGLKQLELADEFDELVGELVSQLLQQAVFGVKGLFDSEPSEVSTGDGPPGAGGIEIPTNDGDPNTRPPGSGLVDIDGDGVDDGVDTDGDGEPDICFFGGLDNSLDPPCETSSGTGGTPGGGGGGNNSQNQPPVVILNLEQAGTRENPRTLGIPGLEGFGIDATESYDPNGSEIKWFWHITAVRNGVLCATGTTSGFSLFGHPTATPGFPVPKVSATPDNPLEIDIEYIIEDGGITLRGTVTGYLASINGCNTP